MRLDLEGGGRLDPHQRRTVGFPTGAPPKWRQLLCQGALCDALGFGESETSKMLKKIMKPALLEAAEQGKVGEMKEILATPGVDLMWDDEEERTALHLAALESHNEILHMLLGVRDDTVFLDQRDAYVFCHKHHRGHREHTMF